MSDTDKTKPRILIVEARFYEDIADALANGALAVLEPVADVERVTVAGAFEIPGAITLAANGLEPYDGYLALGCVIRGETSHYDIVAGESARGLMDLSLDGEFVLTNGVLTVDNREQARVRAQDKDKGGEVAKALLGMLELRERFADPERGILLGEDR